MPNIESPMLQTERLILRELEEGDWQSVYEYGSDPEVVRYLPFGPNTEADTKAFMGRVAAWQKEEPRSSYNFGMVRKIDDKLIGSCRLHIADAESKQGEIGYVLARIFWSQGYMTEAVARIVSFGFDNLGLHRIFATCDPANIGSSRVMEKIGMQREGHLREHKLMKGKWRDSLLYALLERDYRTSAPNGGDLWKSGQK